MEFRSGGISFFFHSAVHVHVRSPLASFSVLPSSTVSLKMPSKGNKAAETVGANAMSALIEQLGQKCTVVVSAEFRAVL